MMLSLSGNSLELICKAGCEKSIDFFYLHSFFMKQGNEACDVCIISKFALTPPLSAGHSVRGQ